MFFDHPSADPLAGGQLCYRFRISGYGGLIGIGDY